MVMNLNSDGKFIRLTQTSPLKRNVQAMADKTRSRVSHALVGEGYRAYVQQYHQRTAIQCTVYSRQVVYRNQRIIKSIIKYKKAP